jgi:putative oxidoreductase
MCLAKLHGHRHAALLLLRVAVGAAFLYHGTMKFGFLTGESSADGFMGIVFPILAIIEPLCGVFLILGLFTQIAAIALAVVMIGAMYTKITGGAEFGKWEFDLLLFAANAVLMTAGAGNVSADVMMKKK